MEILIYVIGTSVLKEINGGIHSKVVILYLFSKNYGKHTKDLYILDLISNSLIDYRPQRNFNTTGK